MVSKMLNMKNSYLVILLLSGYLSIISAKNATLSDLLLRFERGDLDYCRENIDKVAAKNPGNSNILYLRGLLERDGEKAAAIFQELVDKFKTSTKLSAAKKKLAEYASVKTLIQDDDNLLNKQQQTGYGNLIKSVLKAEAKSAPVDSNPVKMIPVGQKAKIESLVKNSEESTDGKLYFIQLGAYSSEKNAKNDLKKYALYKPFVKSAVIRGKLFYLIISGSYASLEEAEKVTDRIRKLHNIEPLIKEF